MSYHTPRKLPTFSYHFLQPTTVANLTLNMQRSWPKLKLKKLICNQKFEPGCFINYLKHLKNPHVRSIHYQKCLLCNHSAEQSSHRQGKYSVMLFSISTPIKINKPPQHALESRYISKQGFLLKNLSRLELLEPCYVCQWRYRSLTVSWCKPS